MVYFYISFLSNSLQQKRYQCIPIPFNLFFLHDNYLVSLGKTGPGHLGWLLTTHVTPVTIPPKRGIIYKEKKLLTASPGRPLGPISPSSPCHFKMNGRVTWLGNASFQHDFVLLCLILRISFKKGSLTYPHSIFSGRTRKTLRTSFTLLNKYQYD